MAEGPLTWTLTLSRCVVPTLAGEVSLLKAQCTWPFKSQGPRNLSASSTLKALEQHSLGVGFSTTTVFFEGNCGSDYDR